MAPAPTVTAMTDYDIDPLGVVRGIQRTVAVTESLATDAALYNVGLMEASVGCRGGIVAVALGDFANHYGKHLPQMFSRTQQVIMATVNGTTAYIEGDQQMADNASSASASAPTGDGSRSQGDGDGSDGTHQPVGICGGTDAPGDRGISRGDAGGGIRRGGGGTPDDGPDICGLPPAVS